MHPGIPFDVWEPLPVNICQRPTATGPAIGRSPDSGDVRKEGRMQHKKTNAVARDEMISRLANILARGYLRFLQSRSRQLRSQTRSARWASPLPTARIWSRR